MSRWTKLRAFPRTFRFAVALWVVYGAMHVSGLRDWVSVLSGTPVEGVPFEIAAVGGMLYVLGWFGAILVAPVLTLGAALSELALRIGATSSSRTLSESSRARR